jgi:hypothetical protein
MSFVWPSLLWLLLLLLPLLVLFYLWLLARKRKTFETVSAYWQGYTEALKQPFVLE